MLKGIHKEKVFSNIYYKKHNDRVIQLEKNVYLMQISTKITGSILSEKVHCAHNITLDKLGQIFLVNL